MCRFSLRSPSAVREAHVSRIHRADQWAITEMECEAHVLILRHGCFSEKPGFALKASGQLGAVVHGKASSLLL